MKKIFTISVLFFCLSAFNLLKAVSYEGGVVTEKGAWCWFADPRALYYENESGTIKNTYIGYIDVHGAIKATQYNHLTKEINEVLIRSFFQPDDHDNPTFLALPDGRIMIFYSRHTDEPCFYYRISTKPGDIRSLGDEKVLKTSVNTTYPSPFILSDDPEHIYLCWRGINWHPTIGRLTMPDANDDVSFDWGPKQIVQSTGARPYAKYASNGKDKVYLTYTTGHPDNEMPNWVYFNYININSDSKQIKLTDVKGKQLSIIDEGVHNVNKKDEYAVANPEAVVNKENFRNWVWQVSMEPTGNPVIAMVRIDNNKDNHDYYQIRWNGSAWQQTHLAYGGGAFHQTPGLEKCYSGGMAIDDENPNIIYCSVPVSGENGTKYEIVKYTINGDNVISEAITTNSRQNNIRPYVVTKSASAKSDLRLVWMNGEYYDWIVSKDRPKGYPTEIHAHFDFPQPNINLEDGLIKFEKFDADVEGNAPVKDGLLITSKTTEAVIVKQQTSTEFSISTNLKISESAYEGKLIQAGTLSYHVDNAILRTGRGTENLNCPFPYLNIDSDKFRSTNILGNADVWKENGRGTGGQWYNPTKLQFFNLTITYTNNTLYTFIDGILDQSIVRSGLTLGDVKIGGFEGVVEDCRVYNRAISQAEIKKIVKEYSESLDLVEFNRISVPENIYTDIVLRSQTDGGNKVVWTSENEAILSSTGLVNLPQTQTKVKLVATMGSNFKEFNVNVFPRNIEKNRLFAYEFSTTDLYEEGGSKYVKDKSENNNNLQLFGSAEVNGRLDLSANSLTGWSTNGYGVAPKGLLKNLRSYTFFMRVTPKHLNKQPRIYDFGTSSSNSVFGRLNGFCAGFKYNGGSTIMINSSKVLMAEKETAVAFTFDAQTKTTKIYVDGEQTVIGTTIVREPQELTLTGDDTRNYIGRSQWWDSNSAADNADYCGTLDDLYLFNIALTESEINDLISNSNLEEVSSTSNFSIYPNPVAQNERVFIGYEFSALEKSRVEVTNMQGQVMQCCLSETNPISFVNTMKSGSYLISITDGNHKMVGKLLVK